MDLEAVMSGDVSSFVKGQIFCASADGRSLEQWAS